MSINQLINPVSPLDIVVNTINGNPPDVVDSTVKLYRGISFISTANPNLTPSIGLRNCNISVEDKRVTLNATDYDSKLVKGTIGFKCVNTSLGVNSSVIVKTENLNLPTTLNQNMMKGIITTFNPTSFYTTSAILSQAVVNGDSDITFTIILTNGLTVNTDEFVLDFEVLCV